MNYAELCEAIDDEIEDAWFASDNELPCYSDSGADIALANQLRNEAENLAGSGLTADAKRRLECFLFPKWWNLEACKNAYRKAMSR